VGSPVNRDPVAPELPLAAPADSLPSTLAGVVDAVWTAIERGCAERWTPWGLPALVTGGADGHPRARTIALRGVEREARRLLFHTDRRSDKVSALKADPRASLLFWSPGEAVEVRLTGRVALHVDDALAQDAWRTASPLSRSAARIALAPGTRLQRSTPFESLVQEGDPAMAFSHFAALGFVADTLDWLWIGRHDLRRARFQWVGQGWIGSWIVP
jgi:pyridoxamine 5'-phosphate oxidase